jgi:hypothetical protein
LKAVLTIQYTGKIQTMQKITAMVLLTQRTGRRRRRRATGGFAVIRTAVEVSTGAGGVVVVTFTGLLPIG